MLNRLRDALLRKQYAVPVPAQAVGDPLTRDGGTAVTNEVLAAAGAYRDSDPIDSLGARLLAIDAKYVSAATLGQLGIKVEGASTEGQPAADDWRPMLISDGSHSDGEAEYFPLTARLGPAAVVGAETKTGTFVVRVDHRRWVRIRYAEVGATSSPGTVTISVSLTT